MLSGAIGCSRLLFTMIPVFATCLCVGIAQNDLSDIQYKEDYDQLQKIVKIADPLARAEKLLSFYKGKSSLNPDLRLFANGNFANDLEIIMKKGDIAAVKSLSERALKMMPKFGEAYLYYAVALKHEKKTEEAMLALAKCYLIKNSRQTKAKQLLDTTFRDYHNGSLVGEDNIIKKATAELK
jgi:hypothetical protein